MQTLVALAAASLVVLVGALLNAPPAPAEVVPEPVVVAPPPAPVVAQAAPSGEQAPSGG